MKIKSNAGFYIGKIQRIAGRIFAKKLKEYNFDDINPAQGRILFVLWKNDKIPIQKLAKETSMGKSTLTSMLDRLEDAGYVKRVHSSDDRREILICRTEKDISLKDVYIKISAEMTDLFYQGFTDGEIEKFDGFLKRIFDNLTDFGQKSI